VHVGAHRGGAADVEVGAAVHYVGCEGGGVPGLSQQGLYVYLLLLLATEGQVQLRQNPTLRKRLQLVPTVIKSDEQLVGFSDSSKRNRYIKVINTEAPYNRYQLS
jgi:hypothetical protein